MRFDKEYKGEAITFGAYVNYIPPSTTVLGKDRPKFADRTAPGILLGYELGYGGRWKEGYVVCPLEAFADVDLHFRSKTVAAKTRRRITVTDNVSVVPGTRPWFPLVDSYQLVLKY